MALKKVKYLDYNYSTYPCEKTCVINTDEVVSAHPTKSSYHSGELHLVSFTNGNSLTLVGSLDQLLEAP